MTTGRALGELWSHGARDWASFVEPHYQSLYKTVHDRLGIGKGTRLLDVGCGPGGAALLAAGRGARVAGLDASPDSIEVARERLAEGDFRVGDMESLPWPDGSFEAVTGFNSFPFAGNPVAALTQAHRVLAPRGKLGIAIFSRPEESQQTKIMAATGALAPPQPANGPSPFALSARAGRNGPAAGRSRRNSCCAALSDGGGRMQGVYGGGGARAIQHSGEERVRRAIVQALEGFRTETGDYRIENRFQLVIAEPAAS
jgi:SAM-dependent methyltransferase